MLTRKDIKVGGRYTARVNDNLTTVRVTDIRAVAGMTRYECLNERTGRTVTFRSALKFKREVSEPEATKAEPVSETTELAFPEKTADQLRLEERTLAVRPVVVPVVGGGLAAHLSRQEDRDETGEAPHLIVEARAGTGKTTTLVQGIRAVFGLDPTVMKVKDQRTLATREVSIVPSPQQAAVWEAMAASKGKAKTVAFCAFNKSIATELKARVPAGCDAMTNHSLGFKAVGKTFGGVKVNEFRVRDILSEITGIDSRQLLRSKPTLVRGVEKLVGLCKMNLTDPTLEALESLADYYEVELDRYRSEAFDLVPRILERCKDVKADNCIDYDDMVWLPVALDLPMFRYDLLLVDEAQDLNRCQQALAKKAGKRLVLCGDPRQAIYGFAGADAESMSRMADELAGTERGVLTLPLTVTRRCGLAIVKEANAIVPDLEAHESNPAGVTYRAALKGEKIGLESGVGGVQAYTTLVQDGDMVLCRVNAPLVSQCFRFLKAGRKANIQGRNIGQGLINLVKKLCEDHDPVENLVGKVDDWAAKEKAKENAKRNPSEGQLINIDDKADCLHCFCEGTNTVGDVIRRIESVFTDDKDRPGIRLSSIHKAKGLEAHRVFFLEPEGATCPHPMARGGWQLAQEYNLRYVAITRAIEELVYVS